MPVLNTKPKIFYFFPVNENKIWCFLIKLLHLGIDMLNGLEYHYCLAEVTSKRVSVKSISFYSCKSKQLCL